MSGPPAPHVEVLGAHKRYAPRDAPAVDALRGLDLALAPGEYVSIEGPSGCGKTSLLNLLGLIDVPTQGEVRWDGRSVADRTERERARLRLTGVGFIFQRFYLLPALTARENVELPMRANRVNAAGRRARAARLLDQVGLGRRADAFPHQLSGGEEQRVAIARALANAPGVLLADEPTGELDAATGRTILDLLDEVHASTGATTVLVTHNPAVAARARRHLAMEDGRIVGDVRSG